MGTTASQVPHDPSNPFSNNDDECSLEESTTKNPIHLVSKTVHVVKSNLTSTARKLKRKEPTTPFCTDQHFTDPTTTKRSRMVTPSSMVARRSFSSILSSFRLTKDDYEDNYDMPTTCDDDDKDEMIAQVLYEGLGQQRVDAILENEAEDDDDMPCSRQLFT